MSDTTTQDQPVDTTPGTFAWNELATSNVEESTNFYTSLFGWSVQSIPGMDEYQMLNVGDRPVAGFMDKSAHCDGPPLWLAYVYVADVGASVAKANELGAETVKDVTDVPGKGSFAIIKDPQGGMLGLWQDASA
ncbi:MAG: VOC family protein [Verrucomicrobiota bacterium]